MNFGEELITAFYTSFANRDAEGMIACYHPQVTFSDPVFKQLNAEQTYAMWRMLVGRAADIHIDFSDVHADEKTGSAHWDASYVFSRTGRKVVNRIDAQFVFKDAKIIKHQDSFDFWTWSRQALGPAGALLGWTPLLQSRVSKGARASLDQVMKKTL